MIKTKKQIAAIIPAGGLSSRMNGFKPLLPLGSGTVIQQVIALFKKAGIKSIIVVAGYRAKDVVESIRETGAMGVVNRDYEKGMFSSIQAGVRNLPCETRAFFMLPADIPVIRPHTIEQMMDQFFRKKPMILHPTFLGRKGHPPLISHELAKPILNHEATGGLRTILSTFDDRSQKTGVADEGILMDMDTSSDYRAVCKRYASMDIPTAKECSALMAIHFRENDDLAAHCMAVERLATRIAGGLNEAGLSLDIPMVRAAALLHDIEKGKPHHAKEGKKTLEKLGFKSISGAVDTHMDIGFSKESTMSEAHVVYLADKLIDGTSFSSIQIRFEKKIQELKNNPGAVARIKQRKKIALDIKKRVEQLTGISIEKIMG